MEWSKIKTIIILILAVSNVFLLGLLVSRAASRSASEQALRSGTIAVFEKSGILMGSEIIPKNRTFSALRLDRDRTREKDISGLLGETKYSNPGGGIDIYSGEKGIALFRGNGEFEIRVNEGALTANPDGYKEYAIKLFEKMGFETEESRLFVGYTDDAVTVTSGQSLDGFSIFNCRAEVVFQNGSLVAVSGRRLTSDPVSSEEMDTISVETALIRFLNYLNRQGDVCNRMEEITPGYVAQTTAIDPVRLVPVWKITTDTGAYYVFCETGAVEKIA